VTTTRPLGARHGPREPSLAYLYLASRRTQPAVVALGACALALRIALHWHWDAYGALQLPLIAEAACAVIVTGACGGPFGDVERSAGSRLPWLRLSSTFGLVAVTVGALSVGASTGHVAGGLFDIVRNTAGLVGAGLIAATLLGVGFAWVATVVILFVGVYGLYSLWHGPALTSPWVFPARPPHDLGGALCAIAFFVIGVTLIGLHGARRLSDE
jgi:hypothetical protein